MKYLCCVAVVLAISASALADIVYTEDFDGAFPAWESGWLGNNSNLENYYGVGAGRGTNPYGLWISDGDGTFSDPSVDIIFDTSFGAALKSFSIDIATFSDLGLQVYDKVGSILLDVPSVPPTFNAGVYKLDSHKFLVAFTSFIEPLFLSAASCL